MVRADHDESLQRGRRNAMRIGRALCFTVLGAFTVGCVAIPERSVTEDDDLVRILDGQRRIAQEVNPLLRRLGEPRVGKYKSSGSEFAVRLIWMPSRGPVMSYRIEQLSGCGPVIAGIAVTDGGIPGKAMTIAYRDQKMVDLESFGRSIRKVVLGSIECFDRPLTELQPVHLGTTVVMLEVYGRDWSHVLLRHEPLEALSASTIADAKRLNPTITDDDVAEETQLRANLARLIAWLEGFWGLRSCHTHETEDADGPSGKVGRPD